VLVMCDASIVTVLVWLKVNSCQIIKHSINMYTRVRGGDGLITLLINKWMNLFIYRGCWCYHLHVCICSNQFNIECVLFTGIGQLRSWPGLD